MLRATPGRFFSPVRLPSRAQLRADGSRLVPATVPPPISGDVGGQYGVSEQYSAEFSAEPFARRMARSTFATRMRENATLYPMSMYRPGELDVRYLPTPFPDPIVNRPLLEVGEADNVPREMKVPVIFLCDIAYDATPARPDAKTSGVKETTNESLHARRFETHFVTQTFMRRKLQPQRLAVYATESNYRLLGLPVRDHKIHAEVPRSRAEYQKLRAKQLWDNERWRFSFEVLFRRFDAGPPELLDDQPDLWDGSEEVASSASASAGGASADGGKTGPKIVRKAKKVKLF
jgi:hypothetical protein